MNFFDEVNKMLNEYAKTITIPTYDRPKRSKSENKVGFIKSLNVDISSYPEYVDKDIKLAVKSLELSFNSIINAGIKIQIQKITWHNVKDSCQNITGRNGFFVIHYKKI